MDAAVYSITSLQTFNDSIFGVFCLLLMTEILTYFAINITVLTTSLSIIGVRILSASSDSQS